MASLHSDSLKYSAYPAKSYAHNDARHTHLCNGEHTHTPKTVVIGPPDTHSHLRDVYDLQVQLGYGLLGRRMLGVLPGQRLLDLGLDAHHLSARS